MWERKFSRSAFPNVNEAAIKWHKGISELDRDYYLPNELDVEEVPVTYNVRAVLTTVAFPNIRVVRISKGGWEGHDELGLL